VSNKNTCNKNAVQIFEDTIQKIMSNNNWSICDIENEKFGKKIARKFPGALIKKDGQLSILPTDHGGRGYLMSYTDLHEMILSIFDRVFGLKQSDSNIKSFRNCLNETFGTVVWSSIETEFIPQII